MHASRREQCCHMTRYGGGPRNRASASLVPALDPAIVELVRRLGSGMDVMATLPWDARARLTTGRGGETRIGSLLDCVEHWLALESDRKRAVITCELALRAPGMSDPADRLEAHDIAVLAKALKAGRSMTRPEVLASRTSATHPCIISAPEGEGAD